MIPGTTSKIPRLVANALPGKSEVAMRVQSVQLYILVGRPWAGLSRALSLRAFVCRVHLGTEPGSKCTEMLKCDGCGGRALVLLKLYARLDCGIIFRLDLQGEFQSRRPLKTRNSRVSIFDGSVVLHARSTVRCVYVCGSVEVAERQPWNVGCSVYVCMYP
jgi:hypothetical protein